MTTKERNLYELKPDSVRHTKNFEYGYSKWTNRNCAFDYWPKGIICYNSEQTMIAVFRLKSRKP